MTLSPKTSSAVAVATFSPSMHKQSKVVSPWNQSVGNSIRRDSFSWPVLTATHPMVHILQPDYYVIYRFAAPGVAVYQQNLRLDLGVEVRYESMVGRIDTTDLHHLQRVDKVLHQFVVECRLQPFDFICSVISQWKGHDGRQRYFMRKSTVLHCDEKGIPCYGIMAFQDITALVSAIKPHNADVMFIEEKATLCYELKRRINAVLPKMIDITNREKEIIKCLYHGMSSKEVAAVLYISKATVDTHRQNMLRKWSVPNTAGLLKRAMEEGWV